MTLPEAPPQMLIPAELVRDERWRPRQKLRPHPINELAALYRLGGPEALPPILAGRLPGADSPILVDGWYRAAAAELAGLEALPAVAHDYADGWAAYAEAVRLANTGPQSLTLGEKGRNIDAFLLQFPEIGPCELAQRLGVTREYVWKRKKRLHEEREAPDLMARHARGLVKELVNLWEAGLPEPAPPDEERLDSVIQAIATAARKCRGDDAGLWLQRLEEAAHGAWHRIAARNPSAAEEGRVRLRTAA